MNDNRERTLIFIVSLAIMGITMFFLGVLSGRRSVEVSQAVSQATFKPGDILEYRDQRYVLVAQTNLRSTWYAKVSTFNNFSNTWSVFRDFDHDGYQCEIAPRVMLHGGWTHITQEKP